MPGHPAPWGFIVLAALATLGQTGCDRNAAKTVAERHCPNLVADTLVNQTAEDLARRGAADGLPVDGATTFDRVTAAVRLNRKDLIGRYPGVVAVTLGPGLGWTFSQSSASAIAYHKVNDYQVVVHLRHADDCPRLDALVSNDHGQRVPVLFVYHVA